MLRIILSLIASFTFLVPVSYAEEPATAVATTSIVEPTSTITQWNYHNLTGPAHWGDISSDYALCKTGLLQSPIDVPRDKVTEFPELFFAYQPAGIDIIREGTTTLTLPDEKTITFNSHAVQLNYPTQTNELIRFDDKTYHLIQLHFHTPGENTKQKKQFPGEIHFVHQGADGEIVVVGVWIQAGKENPVIENIISHLPNQLGVAVNYAGDYINPASLVPVSKTYYRFKGSLTTPPCLEGVRWFMMQNPITASPKQLLALRRAVLGENARPVQPLNDRLVYRANS